MKVNPSFIKDQIGNINIIDIRKSEDCEAKGMIPTSINIFKEELLKEPAQHLNKNEEYYIYCNGGNSASVVSGVLSSLGYKVYSIDGGHRGYLSVVEEN